ncbi:MAG: GerMN domain-containing protein [Anaerolineae bacterium]
MPTPTEEPAPTTEIQPIEVPTEGAVVALPLHVLARIGEPGQEVRATLHWDDGTELSETFTTLAHPEGGGLLVDSLDWTMEGQPPQPETQSATLILSDPAGETLAERDVTVLDIDDAEVQLIDLYWILGENLESEQRPVVTRDDLAATALEELLWGPPPRNLAGFATALPIPQEVLDYPGRQPDWGVRVTLRGLTIEDGVATADFSQEMQAYGGGSTRVQTIREQITRTLMQFPDVNEVRMAIEGETEGILQP